MRITAVTMQMATVAIQAIFGSGTGGYSRPGPMTLAVRPAPPTVPVGNLQAVAAVPVVDLRAVAAVPVVNVRAVAAVPAGRRP
jgi:hypothetical protein